ncbi:MAG: glycosyltransferase [Elusimicrobiota bacterium]|jgi:glycosyltransferase involved in cell wall biosynthesis|nr:glycosyltransferase [Elusimicrobiota bacterium]
MSSVSKENRASVKASVIIPVYNKEAGLSKCLESVLKHKSYPIEIIAVDDSSTDNSVQIIKEYQKKDRRIKLIPHKTNKGAFAARETGILNAKGSYIFCLDADDAIEASCFNKAEPYFGNTDIIAFNALYMHADGKTALYGNKGNESLIGDEIIDGYIRTNRLNNWGVYPKFIKREIAVTALKELAVDARLTNSEDMMFFFSVCFFAESFRRIDSNAYFYSFTEDENASAGRKKYNFDYIINAIEETDFCLKKTVALFSARFDESLFNETKIHLFEFFYRRISPAPKSEKDILIKRMLDIFSPLLSFRYLERVVSQLSKQNASAAGNADGKNKGKSGGRSIALKFFKYTTYKILFNLTFGAIKKFDEKRKKYKQMLGG